MGTLIKSNVSTLTPENITVPTSVFTSWVTAHDGVNATAETSTVLATPLTYSSASVHPVEVTSGTRLSMRARYSVTTTTVTTSPTIRLFACDTLPDPVTGAFPATTKVWRIDSTDPATAGQVLSLNNTSDIRDGTFKYSSNGPGLSTYDMFGARCVFCLHDTAAAVSGGANTTVAIEFSVMN